MFRYALVVLLLGCNVAHAQLTSSGAVSVFETYAGDSIPNPADRLSLISLAKNASVQRAIGMSAEQSKLLDEAFQRNNGSFSSIYWGSQPPPDRETMQQMVDAVKAERAQLLDELITPDQWERLRKIAYQVEIARVGLAKAITEGRLSRDVGVHENQKTHLLEKASQFEAAAVNAIYKVRVDSQTEFVGELSDELEARMDSLIGDPFPFRENTADERTLHRALVRKFSLGLPSDQMPDPQQKLLLSLFLLNARVRQEIEFSDAQLAAFIEASQSSSRDAFELRLGEIVSNEQWSRLRQLCYQIELARMGLKESIAHGRLGQSLQVDAETHKALVDQAAEIEARAGQRIINIRKQAQEQLLAELSSEQRAKAKELLGESFYLENDIYWRYAR